MSPGRCGTVLPVQTRRLATTYGPFDAHVFRNLATGGYVVALVRGDVRGTAPVVARVHSSCVTSEVFGSCDCDCVEQLHAALAVIAETGRGVFFYLMQEGRGAGFTAKARDRMIVQASGERLTTFEAYAQMGLARDYRSYEEVAFVAASLGIEAPLTLLTENPEKVADVERAGVVVAGTVPCSNGASPFNVHYLRAKRTRGVAETVAAVLPERVEYFEPRVIDAAPGLVRTASYLLPIAPPLDGGLPRVEPCWFRLHAYFDLATNRELVVLTSGSAQADVTLVRTQTTPLLERFPLVDGAEARRRWHATVEAFLRAGSGCAVFAIAERDAIAPEAVDGSTSAVRLLAHHVGGRRARPVLDPTSDPAAARVSRALAGHGVAIEPPLVLVDGDAD